MCKNLLTERSTSESEFVELDDIFVEKVWSIPKWNKELRVNPLTLQNELRRSTRTIRAPERYSLALQYLLLTDSGEPECYEEALQVKIGSSGSLLWMIRWSLS